MYSYTISKNASKKEFAKVCRQIEYHFKGICKDKTLEDVDGSTIQIYHTGKSSIKVYNDYEVDAVYIDSEVDLESVL